ncbi:MAG: sodium:calcium symporter [Bacteroidetes bacterium]|nr:MAG: sodium:calcium symporter [Bacteroidota bacterium]
MSNKQDSWGTRVGLILAMAGNAVGLGNFLRFPVQAVQNGGGAFIIPYIVCFLLMGIPLLWVEWSMGRFGGRHGHHSTPFIMESLDRRKFWKYLGVFGIFTNIVVAAYYCYIESWTMSWVYHTLIGTFDGKSQVEVAAFFGKYVDLDKSFTGIPYEPIVFYVFCLLLNTWILSKGLSGGIERVAKILMPLLVVFGVFLAYKGITLKAGQDGASFDGVLGLNFLWQPKFESLKDLNVWLAAAGQIFFTLSVGMGTVHCYAAYVKRKDDIALNAMTAGWTNEFVEVVLGASILIPISIGYLGIDKVVELTQSGGLGLGFKTMPYLFEQWGDVIGTIAGVSFFGLLFFAGITSSLAMGSPWIGFMKDEYKMGQNTASWTFGLVVLALGLPTVFFFNYGVFDEYDYWVGTVALVVFALTEIILFSWVFGLEKGWKEINYGADIKVPIIFRYIIKWVTPLMLIVVFAGSLITPEKGDWGQAVTELSEGRSWPLADGSILAKLANQDIDKAMAVAVAAGDQNQVAELEKKATYVNGSRAFLVIVYLLICGLVYIAYVKRKKEGRPIA